MTPDTLGDFLIRLSKDGELQQEFLKDPGGVMSRAGLSAKEQSLVMTGDEAAIQAYVGDSGYCAALLKF